MGGNIKFKVDGETITGGRIHTYDITDTLEELSKVVKIPLIKLQNNVLGSTYKTDSSGDIDIAIDSDEYNFQEMADFLKTSHDWVETNSSLKIIHILMPIEGTMSKKILGDECNGYIQVDLMFGNPEWMKFSYFSPGKKSKFKGWCRTELIKSVALTKTQFKDEDTQGEILAKIGMVLDPNIGLVTHHRMRRRRKDGQGFLKRMEKVLPLDDEWRMRYGDKDFKEIKITNADEAAAFLFGNGVKAKDIETFEQVTDLVNKMSKEKRYIINKIFAMKTGYLLSEVPEGESKKR